jgi:plastocyanin
MPHVTDMGSRAHDHAGIRLRKTERRLAILFSGLVLTLALTGYLAASPQGKGCTEANPATLANAGNTCGSSSNPCIVDVKRTSESASATPSIAGAKANKPFAVKVGTTVTWQSVSKNTGFVVDFGSSSPFDPPGAIMGGSDRSASVVAKRPGCYTYSVGACVAGTTYGMCDSKTLELVVSGAN